MVALHEHRNRHSSDFLSSIYSPLRTLIQRLPKYCCGLLRHPSLAVAIVLSFSTLAFADPLPIEYNNVTNSWETTTNSFNQSGSRLNFSRFATIDASEDKKTLSQKMIAMTSAPGDDRRFLLTHGWKGNSGLFVLPAGGNIGGTSAPGIDLGALLKSESGDNESDGFSGGFRGIAFHPDFNNSGEAGYKKFYTSQMVNHNSSATFLSNPGAAGNDMMVSEWTANLDGNGHFTSIASHREVIRMRNNTESAHALQQVVFNPFANSGDADYGLLHIAIGDGANVNKVNLVYGSGENLNNPQGKVLRINPLASGANAYTVPGDNPFNSTSGALPEIYARGLRNPQTLSFFQDANGDTHMLAADIGQADAEEINLIRKGGGQNFGWVSREGPFQGYTYGGPKETKSGTGVTAGDGYIYPAAQLGHGNTANAIVGGYVIDNGSPFSAGGGRSVFGEFSVSGMTFDIPVADLLAADTVAEVGETGRLVDPAEAKTTAIYFDKNNDGNYTLLSIRDIFELDGLTPGGRLDIRFAQGANGELYLLNKHTNTVYLATNTVPEPCSALLASLSFLGLGFIRRRRNR